MSNTNKYNDPDTMSGQVGKNVAAVYVVDPSTQLAISPAASAAQAGYVAAYSGNAAALTANTDYTFKWGSGGTTQINHLWIQNNWTVNINVDLDVVTTAGSPVLAPGQSLFLDVQTTVLHIQGNGTPNINGATAGNIVVRGWM